MSLLCRKTGGYWWSERKQKHVRERITDQCSKSRVTQQLLPSCHGHPQPSNWNYTADRQRKFLRNSHIYSYISHPQDIQDQNCLGLKTLRLVCSQFNHAFEAQVLSTLVIAVTKNTLKHSLDMLCTFASQNEKTSRAVQHARTLKIKYLSPTTRFPIPQHDEPESQDPSPSSSTLICRLSSAISSLKLRFKWVCSLSSFS